MRSANVSRFHSINAPKQRASTTPSTGLSAFNSKLFGCRTPEDLGALASAELHTPPLATPKDARKLVTTITKTTTIVYILHPQGIHASGAPPKRVVQRVELPVTCCLSPIALQHAPPKRVTTLELPSPTARYFVEYSSGVMTYMIVPGAAEKKRIPAQRRPDTGIDTRRHRLQGLCTEPRQLSRTCQTTEEQDTTSLCWARHN